MCRAGASKGAVFPPGSSDVVKVALSYHAPREAGATGEGLDGHFVEALALLPAQRRKTISRVFETFRMVYCMQLL